MAITKHFDPARNAWVICPVGYLDLFDLPQVGEALSGTEGADILFDCAQLRYVDSAVLKRMAETAAQKKAEGYAFRICNLQLYIYKILEMTGLDRAFSFAEGGDAE